MSVQVGITAFIWIGSRRFSPYGGFFGEHVDQVACRRGYEWYVMLPVSCQRSIIH